MRGTVNLRTDVYSFGVVMLEVLTGKNACNPFSEEEWEDKKREICEEEKKRKVREKEQKNVEWNEKEEREERVEQDMLEESDEANNETAKKDNFAPYSLLDFVPLIEMGELWKVLDRRPAAEPTPRQLEAAELVAEAAVRCLRLNWEARPSISEVVATLETALELARCDG
ncbi:unnamed protein product [Urochloa humidicola]